MVSDLRLSERLARRAHGLRVGLLGLVGYVPLLATAPGRVAADTKTYLYLDPDRVLARAASMWDPNIGLGTVTHQNIGYLFPMGPWYWAAEHLGVPDWVAQRLWLGTLLVAAGTGMLFLLRTLRPEPPASGGLWCRIAGHGELAAALVYMLTPYVLAYAARLSGLLLPWAALPWLVALLVRALRTGSWRHPAAFAVVVAVAGSVNATALVLAGIAPVLWIVFAVWVQREVSVRRAAAVAAKIAALSLACSAWWIAGLSIQGQYGIDILRYTETLRTVAHTSTPAEVLRGLGYWFFYGGDKLEAWIEARDGYLQHLWLIGATFAVPLAAFAAAVTTRWRYRAVAVGLVVVGTVVAVGAHPYDAPAPFGALVKWFATTDAGLAMRSTARAVSVVVLGTALLVAGGLFALTRRSVRAGGAASLAVGLVAALGLAPLFAGEVLGDNLLRDEDIPAYWHDAAAYLDARDPATRVLEIPGSDFAAYRWGMTVDPVTPGLMDRPYVARELVPWGSPASADLLNAVDRRLHDDQLDPDTLAPLARLLGAGDVVLRNDLEYERYRTPRPRLLWAQLVPPPDGLGAPVGFGDPVPNVAAGDVLRDEIELAIPPGTPDPPPVAVLAVEDPRPIVRAAGLDGALLLAGDGEGVVAAAQAGLLDGDRLLVYSAALTGAGGAALRDRLLDHGATLVLTDTNRQRGRRWSTVWENTGYTEQRGEEPLLDDPSDNRLDVFPDAPPSAFTTVEQRGVRAVRATRYGNPVTFTPENRPAFALDGDLDTAWRVGDFSPVRGERLRIDLTEPVTTDAITVVQPLFGAPNRWITELIVRLDGEEVATVALDESSRTPRGQRIDLGERTFSTVELEVAGDNVGERRRYDGISPVGFAEVRIPGIRVDEVVRLPSDLLDAAGAASRTHDLVVLLERLRANALDPGRRDEEPAMVRAFALPTRRTFVLTGEARLSAAAPAATIDRLLGLPGPAGGGVAVDASSFLPGNFRSRPAAALDGDPGTAWRTRFGDRFQAGAWLEVTAPETVEFDHLDLVLVDDGDHSVPTEVAVEAGGEERVVAVPDAPDGPPGATREVRVRFPPLRGDRVRITVREVAAARSVDYYSGTPIDRPLGIAEVGIPGVVAPRLPTRLPGACRADLLQVDGRAVPLRVEGRVDDALDRRPLTVRTCALPDRGTRAAGTAGDPASALTLAAGDHVVRARPGGDTGLDLDVLALRSDAPGDPPAAASSGGAPRIEVEGETRTSLRVRVDGAREPFMLVLGQSHNPGWTARVDGGPSLGAPILVDGFANGWLVDPTAAEPFTVVLEWTPQRRVRLALGVSAVALAACTVGAVGGALRARRRGHSAAPGPGDGPVAPAPASPLRFGGRPPAAGWPVVALAAGAAAAGALVASPAVGLGAAAVVALALARGQRGRRLLAGAAVGSLAAAAAFVLARQVWRGGPPPDFEWPTYFEPAEALAWLALLLLAADVVIEVVAHRRAGPDG